LVSSWWKPPAPMVLAPEAGGPMLKHENAVPADACHTSRSLTARVFSVYRAQFLFAEL
jgi:hypothetical protein